MSKFILVVFVAICLGVGTGICQSWLESSSVEEHFSVYQDFIKDEDKKESKAAVNTEGTNPDAAGANVPTATVVGPTVHNFGSLEKGETGDHTFTFKNTGTGPLTITLSNTSCKCTLSDLRGKKQTIAPGQSFPVKLTFKSENWAKKFRQSATIQTNDPARRVINLYVEGVILQPIRPEPAKIVFSNTTPSQESEARIKLYGYKWNDVKIENLEFLDEKSKEFFVADATPLTDEDLQKEINSQCGYLITIKTRKGLPLGPLRQTLKISTNKEVLELPITGRVTGEFIISMVGSEYDFDEEKNQIKFGKLVGDRDVSVDLMLSTGRKFGSLIKLSMDEKDVIPSSKHIKVEILYDKFRRIGRLYQYPIRVTIPKDCPNVSYLGPEEQNLGRFVINTTHPTEKKIEIYVQFAKAR